MGQGEVEVDLCGHQVWTLQPRPDGALSKSLYKMAASLKDKRTPITTPPYQVPSVDISPDSPIFSRCAAGSTTIFFAIYLGTEPVATYRGMQQEAPAAGCGVQEHPGRVQDHCCQIPPGPPWASPAKKIKPLEKKLGRKPATPPNHLKKCSKNFCMQIIANYC
jgi:hypothetical protein